MKPINPDRRKNNTIRRLIRIYKNRTNGWNLCLLDLVRKKVKNNTVLLEIIEEHRDKHYAFLFFCEDPNMHWDCTKQADKTADFLNGLLPVKPNREKKVKVKTLKTKVPRQKKLTAREVRKAIKLIPTLDEEKAHGYEDSICREFIRSIAANKYKPGEEKGIAALILNILEMEYDRWYA